MNDLLEIVYDHLAGNEVRHEDSLFMFEALSHVDYKDKEIVFTVGDKEYVLTMTERDV